MNHTNQTVLCDDPETGQTLDVTSMFELLHYFENEDAEDNIKTVCKLTDDVCMMMARGMHDDILSEEAAEYRENMNFLARLRRAVHEVKVVVNE